MSVLLLGCGGHRDRELPQERVEGGVMNIRLTSSAFGQNQPIPSKYTGEGQDLSPPLAWDAPPVGTKELALICDDPDAPQAQPWVHWVIFKIPAQARALPENIGHGALLTTPAGATQGINSFGKIGYGGPMPPRGYGVHHYYFKLYAIDKLLMPKAGAGKDDLLAAMSGSVIGQGELIGTYERK